MSFRASSSSPNVSPLSPHCFCASHLTTLCLTPQNRHSHSHPRHSHTHSHTHSNTYSCHFRTHPVIPAKAGIQLNGSRTQFWIPACAGMTVILFLLLFLNFLNKQNLIKPPVQRAAVKICHRQPAAVTDVVTDGVIIA